MKSQIPQILYIENEPSEIEKIQKLFKDEYEIIPNSIDEIKLMKDEITKGHINDFVRKKIQTNYQNLRMIICDLELIPGNKNGGANVIKFIRNDLEVPEKILVPKLIPIIILTTYSDEPFAQSAIDNGATHNINKRDIKKIFFKDIVKAMIRYYSRAYLERDFDYLKKVLNDIFKEFEKQNKLILLGFENNDITKEFEKQNKLILLEFGTIETLLQTNHEETLAKFDLLFNFLFKSFNNHTQQKIFESFKTELGNIISTDQQEKLNESTWNQIKSAIKEVNSGGGFKTFVDSTYDILNEADILGSKGKIVGIAIKGIFGILASN